MLQHPLLLPWFSLTARLKRGEGGLWGIHLSLFAYAQLSLPASIAWGVISLFSLMCVYAFNDWNDCYFDQKNPKKDTQFLKQLIEQHSQVAWSLATYQLLVLGVTYLMSPQAAYGMLGLVCTNILYSKILKGVPFLDVMCVGVWGAFYLRSLPISLEWNAYVVIATLTAISHIFQIIDDTESDKLNQIRTSAVCSATLPHWLLLGSCLMLSVLLNASLGILGGVIAFIPLGLYFMTSRTSLAWMSFRIYVVALWGYLLFGGHFG